MILELLFLSSVAYAGECIRTFDEYDLTSLSYNAEEFEGFVDACPSEISPGAGKALKENKLPWAKAVRAKLEEAAEREEGRAAEILTFVDGKTYAAKIKIADTSKPPADDHPAPPKESPKSGSPSDEATWLLLLKADLPAAEKKLAQELKLCAEQTKTEPFGGAAYRSLMGLQKAFQRGHPPKEAAKILDLLRKEPESMCRGAVYYPALDSEFAHEIETRESFERKFAKSGRKIDGPAVLRRYPNGPSSGWLSDGARVVVSETRSGWVKILDEYGSQSWTHQKNLRTP